jgi:hypothetical protein
MARRLRTLEECKGGLAELLANAPPGIQYSKHLEGDSRCGRYRLEAPRAPAYRSARPRPGSKKDSPVPGVTRFDDRT